MRIVHIPKKGTGRFRTIYIPPRKQRDEMRKWLPELAKLFAERPSSRVAHGFCKDRSPVTNALEHRGRAYTIAFDLRDFFDTVTADKLAGIMPQYTIEKVLVDGAARQGLPTSPAVANLAAMTLDQAILIWVLRQPKASRTVYTRYADDLTISTDHECILAAAETTVPLLVDVCGFTLATEKTRIYRASAGRRMVTGVAVDNDIHPTRKLKRRLRAARHRGHVSQAEGLMEWCRLRLPRTVRLLLRQQLQAEYGRNVRHLSIPGLPEDMDDPDAVSTAPVPVINYEISPDNPVDEAGRSRRIQLE